jgi:FtsH-binding integral membrane protein
MADRSALESAAAAGIINAEQVGPLYNFLATGGVAPAPAGEEDLRFIRNFHDVFLAIGIALFAVGLAVGISAAGAGADSPQQGASLAGILCLGAAVMMWGLGELFARRRRLFLPAIATVSALTLFAVFGVALLYAGAVIGRDVNIVWDGGGPDELRVGLLIAAAFAFIAPGAFYARFRLPFSMGMAGGGVAFFVIVAAIVFAWEMAIDYLPALYLTLGALLFAAAVAFDARDPARVSRSFWAARSALLVKHSALPAGPRCRAQALCR